MIWHDIWFVLQKKKNPGQAWWLNRLILSPCSISIPYGHHFRSCSGLRSGNSVLAVVAIWEWTSEWIISLSLSLSQWMDNLSLSLSLWICLSNNSLLKKKKEYEEMKNSLPINSVTYFDRNKLPNSQKNEIIRLDLDLLENCSQSIAFQKKR